MLKRVLCLAVFLSLIFTLVAGSAANAASETQSELSKLEDMLAAATTARENAEQALSDAEKNYSDALAQKQAIDNKIYSLSVEIEATVALLEGYSAQIEEKNAEIDAENEKMDQAYATLRERMRSRHENGNSDILALVFDSDGLTELFVAIDRFMCMLDYDSRAFASYSNSIAELELLRTQLTESKAKLDEQMKTLEVRKREFEKAKADAEKFIASTESQIASAEKTLENVEKIELEYAKKREQLLADLEKTSNQSYVGGDFLWPLPAGNDRISSGYGWRIHPVTKKQQFHRGIDIPAPYGTDIYAVNDGVVVECSYNYADGYFITVSHGGGIASFYSHLSRYRVNVGDKVVKGQVIANVGNSGYTTGAHLNLNIYKDGEAVDPKGYLPAKYFN